ncbi:MAG: hypothetical protein VKK04_06675 [Synechococcales bacterium]|nr:hypothetical protein [Synechococcales bacterium]
MDILQSCNFDIIYDRGDYLVAREVPGGVNFAKLVTVEVVIDKSLSEPESSEELHMNFVVKNEELPLQADNHCRQKFNLVNQTLSSAKDLQLIEYVA